MKARLAVIAIMAIVVAACTNSAQKESEQADTNSQQHMDSAMDHSMGSTMGSTMDIPDEMVTESTTASSVIDSYLELKNALTEDDDGVAASAGKNLIAALDNLDESTVDPDKVSYLLDIVADARTDAEHIAENSGNIEHQREHFDFLSSELKDIISLTGADRNLYEIFCPMYNDSKGAMWLSASDDVINPYYGSEMINCGEVTAMLTVK